MSCRVLENYRSQSTPGLSNIIDSVFWAGVALRLIVTEPIVRHAVLAISSLHEHRSNNKERRDTVGPSFIYSQYGKSISALRKWKTGDGPTIPLQAYVLYTCLEFLLDNEKAARIHIMQVQELAYDAYATALGTIVSLASIAPIYWTAQKFQHPLLRRAAVKLLMKDELKNRRENVWHSNEAIAIALRTMELEDSIDEFMVVADERIKAFGLESPTEAWHVPLDQPLTLSLEQIEEEQHLYELLEFNKISDTAMGNSTVQGASSLARVLDLRAEAAHLLSPNVLIGVRDKTGTTVTIFREPRIAKNQWDVRKQFIPFL
ncbi:hypothetical protein MY1884_005775 [Beauveria asiatica]